MTGASDREPDADARQRAVDPVRSVILEAPAGSGKTRLLVERYVNLLPRVERPEEILAITFTTKAAAEMRERVLATLAGDSALAEAVRGIDERRGWDLDNRPDRLKIQTIDSFAFSLARRQPIASAYAAEAPTEDAEALYEEAGHRLLARIAEADPHADTLAGFVALLDNDAARAKAFIAEALGKRDQWIDAVQDTARATERVLRSIADGLAHLRRAAIDHLNATFDAELRSAIESVGRHVAAWQDEAWAGLDDPRSWQLAATALVTKDGKPRRRLDKRQGFEPRHRVEKDHALATAAAIGNTGLTAQLATVQTLPGPAVDAGAEVPLRAIATALTFAVTDLGNAFAAQRMMDFTEITLAANRALVVDDLPTELAQALDYRIRHVLVDEFQDTSLSQHRMLVALLEGWERGGGNSFFAVGDPMQSIYRFRDADLRLFLTTAARGFEHLPLEPLRLTSNFRSAKPLVDWCNGVFAALFGTQTNPIHGAVAFTPAVPKAQPSSSPASGVRTLVCVGDSRAQGDIVAARVDELVEQDSEAGIAILVRSRAVLDHILPALRARGIVWRGTDVEPLMDEPAVRDLQSLTEVLFGAQSGWLGAVRLAWLALLRSPLVGLELADLERAAQPGMAFDGNALSAPGRGRWQRLAVVLEGDRRSLPPRARVERIWLALGGAEAYRAPTALANAERFFDLLDARPAIARRPADLGRALARLYAADTLDDANVQVMTIHKAKGLEFDHVIVPGLEHVPTQGPNPLLLWRPEGEGVLIAARTQRGANSLYDWLGSEEKAKDANELKRLFYVAATRAAHSLTLIGAVANAEPDTRPPKGSLLALIWDHVYDEITFVARPAAADGARKRTLSRLPAGFSWSPPVALPALTAPTTPAARSEAPAPIDGRREVVLGELVHRELKLIADGSDPEHYDPGRRIAVWQRWLMTSGLSDADAEWVASELERQIRCVVDDEPGRWLLGSRANAMSEAPFTSIVDGEPARMVVDRTFVDAGQRWIIDFKSSVIPDQRQTIDVHCRRHAPQLRRYANALAALADEPVRTAIYFTSIPRLVEIDADRGTPTTGEHPIHASQQRLF